jgi:hypothetical protein
MLSQNIADCRFKILAEIFGIDFTGLFCPSSSPPSGPWGSAISLDKIDDLAPQLMPRKIGKPKVRASLKWIVEARGIRILYQTLFEKRMHMANRFVFISQVFEEQSRSTRTPWMYHVNRRALF